jgi:hypothetical protein
VSPISDSTQRLIAALETGGLLLLQDKLFPSAVGLITGESLAGSWWSHPRGNDIFRAVSARRSSRRSGMQALLRQGYVRAPDALAGGRGRGAGG